MTRDPKATTPRQHGAPPEPDEEVIGELLARFVARQNELLKARNAKSTVAAAAAKATGKRATKKP